MTRELEEIFATLLNGPIRQLCLSLPVSMAILTSVLAALGPAASTDAPNGAGATSIEALVDGGAPTVSPLAAPGPGPATDAGAPAPQTTGLLAALQAPPGLAQTNNMATGDGADQTVAPPGPSLRFLAHNDPDLLAVQAARAREDEEVLRRALIDTIKRQQRSDDFRAARRRARINDSRERKAFEAKFGNGSWDPSRAGGKSSKRPRRDDMEVDGRAAGSSTVN